MDLSTFLILLIIVLILISIGFMIPEPKYKISYFMIVCLLGLTVLNVYMSIVYYIQLRNDPGLPGAVGNKGPTGVKGLPGKCSFTQTCEIKNPRDKIIAVANTMYGISKKYGITIEQLIASNPSAEKGVKIGQELIIPSIDASKIVTSIPLPNKNVIIWI